MSTKTLPPVGNKKAGKSGASGPVLVPKVETLESEVDRLGYLRARHAELALQSSPVKNEIESLEAKLLARFPQLMPEQVIVAEGKLYTAKIGAKADEQALVAGGLDKVFGWIGQLKFIERAKITFEQLSGLLSPEQYTEVVRKARTGRRSITVVAKVLVGGPQAA